MRSIIADRRTFKSERLVFFSDAVMAVAITLLVLDLKLPEGVTDAELAGVLWGSLHNVGAYALSFVVIGILWMSHHAQFTYIRRVDGVILWLNLLFLMTIGLLPFVTSVLSDHGTPLSTALYAGTLVATSLLSTLIWAYASRDIDLMPPDVPRAIRREGLLTPLLTAAVFAVSIPVAFVWGASAGQLTWLLVLAAGPIAGAVDSRVG